LINANDQCWYRRGGFTRFYDGLFSAARSEPAGGGGSMKAPDSLKESCLRAAKHSCIGCRMQSGYVCGGQKPLMVLKGE
jgi:hypothetical protein